MPGYVSPAICSPALAPVMKIPLTVALLTYNRPHYLQESLQAVVGQTYGDFELLVLDNGSTDHTPDVVLGFKDKRIRYVRNAPGHPASFNGLSAVLFARGVRLLVTHDDDVMEPDMLEQQMALLARHPELTAVWTNQSIINEHGQLLQTDLNPPGPTRIYAMGEYIASMPEERQWHAPSSLIFTPGLLPLTTLHRKYLDIPVGTGKPMVAEGSNDYILPAEMNLKGPVAFLNQPLLRYRQHPMQETNHNDLTGGVLHGFKEMRRFATRTPCGRDVLPIFDALISRYAAQDLMTRVDTPLPGHVTRRRLRNLLERNLQGISAVPRATYQLLPLALLLVQLEQHPAARALLAELPPPGPNLQTSIHRCHQWVRRRLAGENLFTAFPAGSRIVILGSVLISALLVIEARQAGLEVVCCLDSSVTRQGHTWLGVEIMPPAWLADNHSPLDLIVLSSERDHEDELFPLIGRYDATTPIVSWKQLADPTWARTPPHAPQHGAHLD